MMYRVLLLTILCVSGIKAEDQKLSDHTFSQLTALQKKAYDEVVQDLPWWRVETTQEWQGNKIVHNIRRLYQGPTPDQARSRLEQQEKIAEEIKHRQVKRSVAHGSLVGMLVRACTGSNYTVIMAVPAFIALVYLESDTLGKSIPYITKTLEKGDHLGKEPFFLSTLFASGIAGSAAALTHCGIDRLLG